MSRTREARPPKVAPQAPGAPPAPLWVPLVIACLTFAAFLPALHNQLTWDDDVNLVDNPYYRGLGWAQLGWMWTTVHMGHWIPLTWMTFGLDYLLWGMKPLGYHLTSLLLHATNAVTFYFVALRILRLARPGLLERGQASVALAAGFAALLFALHPLRVESVAWATERRDVLSGCFFLWAIYCYLRAALSPQILSRRRWLWTAAVIYSLSLFSKATAMALPAVLLLLAFYPLRRLQGGPINWFRPQLRSVLWEKVPFLVLAIVFAAIALLAQHSIGTLKPLPQYDTTSRITQTFYGVIIYLWKALLPTRLSPLYELP